MRTSLLPLEKSAKAENSHDVSLEKKPTISVDHSSIEHETRLRIIPMCRASLFYSYNINTYNTRVNSSRPTRLLRVRTGNKATARRRLSFLQKFDSAQGYTSHESKIEGGEEQLPQDDWPMEEGSSLSGPRPRR